jgi:hypothetical protein
MMLCGKGSKLQNLYYYCMPSLFTFKQVLHFIIFDIFETKKEAIELPLLNQNN